MKFLLSELSIANKEFKTVFGIGIYGFIENQISAAKGQLVLNIIDFHKYLEKEKPGNNDKSFNALVSKEYGTKASKLIKKLTL